MRSPILCLSFIAFLLGGHSQVVRHIHPVNLNDSTFKGLASIDKVAPGYALFLTGENHLFQHSNKYIQFHLLKMLHQRHGVDHLFIEFGASAGQIIDKYVATGDTSLQEYLTYQFAASHMAMWDSIRVYNESLPDSARIHVVGVDLDRHDFVQKAFELYRLDIYDMDSSGYHAEVLTASYDNVPFTFTPRYYRRDSYNEEDMYRACSYFLRKPEEANRLFADSSSLFLDLVESYHQGMEFQRRMGRSSGNLIRERYMARKVVRFYEADSTFKAMGQFGRCHVELLEPSQRCPNDFHSFSSRLERLPNSVLKGRILSMPIVYKDETTLWDWSMSKDKLYEEILEQLTDSLTDQDLYILELDSSKHYELGNYQFAIYNTRARREESTADWVAEDYWEMNAYSQVHFGVTLSRRSYKLGELSTHLQSLGYSGLSNEKFTMGGELTTLLTEDWWNFAFSLRGEGLAKERLTGPNGTADFSAWQLMGFMGYPLPDSRWFSFTPMVGLGGGALRLKEYYTATGAPILGGTIVNRTNNPSMLLGAVTDVRFTIYMMSLNISAGYQLDVSNKSWKREGSRLSTSPESSMSGWNLSAGVSLYIKGY